MLYGCTHMATVGVKGNTNNTRCTCVYRRRTYQQVRLLVPVSACIPSISRPQPTWAFRRSTLTPKQVLSVAVLVITFRNAN